MIRPPLSALFISQALIIWSLPIDVAAPSHNIDGVFHQQTDESLIPGRGFEENRPSDSVESEGAFAPADVRRFTRVGSQNLAVVGSHNLAGARRHNSAGEGDRPRAAQSNLHRQILPRCHWHTQTDLAGVDMGQLDLSSTIEYPMHIEPPSNVKLPRLPLVCFITDDHLRAYTQGFKERLDAFASLFGSKKKRQLLPFDGINMCVSESFLADHGTMYLIRIGEAARSRKKTVLNVKKYQEIQLVFESIVKRLLLVHSHFLRSCGSEKALAPEKHKQLMEWLCKLWFYPEGGLPLVGVVRSLPLVRNEKLFGSVQRLFVEFIDLPRQRRNFGRLASILVATWYKTTRESSWPFVRDEDFWELISSGLKYDDNSLLEYIIPASQGQEKLTQLEMAKVAEGKRIRNSEQQVLLDQPKMITTHNPHVKTTIMRSDKRKINSHRDGYSSRLLIESAAVEKRNRDSESWALSGHPGRIMTHEAPRNTPIPGINTKKIHSSQQSGPNQKKMASAGAVRSRDSEQCKLPDQPSIIKPHDVNGKTSINSRNKIKVDSHNHSGKLQLQKSSLSVRKTVGESETWALSNQPDMIGRPDAPRNAAISGIKRKKNL